MGYIGPIPAQVPLTSSDIEDGIITADKLATGTVATELYGFKKTNGTGSQLEDLIMTYTNGADDLSVATNNTTQSDLYDESFVAKRGLTLAVNADGELNVTV